MSDKVVKGFAFLGLISIVALSLYYIVKGLQKLQYDKTYAEVKIPTWPPYDYMQNVGSVCPTGWTIGGASGDKIECSHLNYTNSDSNHLHSFTPIADWKDCITKYSNNPGDCPELQDRCTFLNDNTYTDNSRIPWIGVSNLCN